MATHLKSLAKGAVPTSQIAVYTVPAAKAAAVKNLRFVNTGSTVTVNAFFRRTASGTPVRILDKDKQVAAGLTNYTDEFFLEADDRIELIASSAIDYVISGTERDQ